MNDQPQTNEPSPRPEAETDVLTLLKKMQQQLIFLEKKIDVFINNQSQARPSFGDKRFSKPHRPFGRPFHRPDGESGGSHPGKSFHSGRPYEKRQGGEGDQGFSHKKHGFDKDREGGSGSKRPFKKWHGNEGSGFGPKKKPFYQPFKHKH